MSKPIVEKSFEKALKQLNENEYVADCANGANSSIMVQMFASVYRDMRKNLDMWTDLRDADFSPLLKRYFDFHRNINKFPTREGAEEYIRTRSRGELQLMLCCLCHCEGLLMGQTAKKRWKKAKKNEENR